MSVGLSTAFCTPSSSNESKSKTGEEERFTYRIFIVINNIIHILTGSRFKVTKHSSSFSTIIMAWDPKHFKQADLSKAVASNVGTTGMGIHGRYVQNASSSAHRAVQTKIIWGEPTVGKGLEEGNIHVASVGAPTHDMKAWGKLSLEDKIEFLDSAFNKAFEEWEGCNKKDAIYIFTAPEYFFSANNSHFLEKNDYDKIQAYMQDKFKSLPDNLLIAPGTIGWKEELEGEALQSYLKLHEEQQELIKKEMTENGLSRLEVDSLLELWEQEPSTSSKRAFVYHNDALIFKGGEMEIYSKRYESPSEDAVDRQSKELKDGYFHLGKKPYATNINEIPIKLEICSDNSYESIKKSDYKGVHVVLASNFGEPSMNSTIHGETYIHHDSAYLLVATQEKTDIVKTREAAFDRKMIENHQAKSFTPVDNKQLSLSFFRVGK